MQRTSMVDADERVILVDDADREIGTWPKLDAHRRPMRHRAFSVFLTNPDGAVLLQSRALTKYHSGGLWANACCGHPRAGEPIADAARRRLQEEMGVDADLQGVGKLSYQALLPNGWFEDEIVHLFTGEIEVEPRPDPAEVGAWRWFRPGDLTDMHADAPEAFAAWFRIYAARRPDLAFHARKGLLSENA